MPTYDYKCESCDNTFEIFQSIKDEPLKLCPKCGHNTLIKMVSMPAGLIFKGSGFYLTDYKKNSGGSSGGSVSATSPSTTDTKKETKKESKKETKSKKDS